MYCQFAFQSLFLPSFFLNLNSIKMTSFFPSSSFFIGGTFSSKQISLKNVHKVWFIKTCTHIFTHSTILCQFFKNMYYFEEIRLVEHSKLLRQVKILQKMCPLHSHLKKNFFHIFWIFMWNRCTKVFKKTQDFLTKNDIYFVPWDHNSPNSPQIWPIENFFWYFKAACVCWKLVCKVQRRLNS